MLRSIHGSSGKTQEKKKNYNHAHDSPDNRDQAVEMSFMKIGKPAQSQPFQDSDSDSNQIRDQW
jgi:hypothetical protein